MCSLRASLLALVTAGVASDAPFLISSTIFGGGRYLASCVNGKGFIGFKVAFDCGDPLTATSRAYAHRH